MKTTNEDIVEYYQEKAPIRLFVEGIVLILLTSYCIMYLTFNFSFEIPMRLNLSIIAFTAVNLFAIFKRLVVTLIFDNEKGEIRVSYYHYFFRKHTVVVKYAKAGFLAFNQPRPLNSRKSCNGLTELRIYDDRKYIARVVISRKGWKSEHLEEMVDILTDFAHEFQVSPGLL